MAGTHAQINMTRGEVTPLIHARLDLDHYSASLAICRGWVPLRYGGVTRMPGTFFRAEVKDSSRKTRIIPFKFNRRQVYAIEAGEGYFRFQLDTGRIEVGGSPIEVSTPYAEEDLPYLQYRQSGDALYITCRDVSEGKGHVPQILRRLSETSWTIEDFVPYDGPYLPVNDTATTLTPSGTGGTVTITASATTGINDDAGFVSTDVGRCLRVLPSDGTWRWFYIVSVVSSTQVTAELRTDALPDTAAMTEWRLGLWGDTMSWPTSIGMYEDRLLLAHTVEYPTAVWGSVSADYPNFGVSDPLVADDAVDARMTGGELNDILWVADGADILVGTEGTVRSLGRTDVTEAFGPTNARQRPQTVIPAADVPATIIENMLLFVAQYGTKLYEAAYVSEAEGYVARELTALNEHLFLAGVIDTAYQPSPAKTLWCVTSEGQLLAAAYDRDQKTFGVAPAQVNGFVESVACLPGTNKDGDHLWLVVRHTIDGQTVRYIERLASFYREGTSAQEYPVYGDVAGVYDGIPTTYVAGLDWLEGKTVGIWLDGVDIGDATVSSGRVDFPRSASGALAVIGLRKECYAETLRTPAATGPNGSPYLGARMQAQRAQIDVYQTAGLSVGTPGYLDRVDIDGATEGDPFAATTLVTGAFPVSTDGMHDSDGVLAFSSNSMYPATVRALFVDLIGGN